MFGTPGDNLLVELGKYGMDQRDWHAPVNLFSKIIVDDGPESTAKDGSFLFDTSHRQPGQSVTLRAELDVLVLMSVTPHRFDAGVAWPPQNLQAELIAGEPAGLMMSVASIDRRTVALMSSLILLHWRMIWIRSLFLLLLVS